MTKWTRSSTACGVTDGAPVGVGAAVAVAVAVGSGEGVGEFAGRVAVGVGGRGVGEGESGVPVAVAAAVSGGVAPGCWSEEATPPFVAPGVGSVVGVTGRVAVAVPEES